MTTKTPPLELATGPLDHVAMDYAALRAEAIRYLEALTGPSWTDFNAHDPGITLLEQLCFAITDLSYRANHSVPDLLASGGRDPRRSLPSAGSILTSHPITVNDLRMLVLDVEGVRNAWLEPLPEPIPSVHYHPYAQEIRLQAEGGTTQMVPMLGVHRVLIDPVGTDQTQIRQAVMERLEAFRPVCEGFHVQFVDPVDVQVEAQVEIEAVEDIAGLLKQIFENIIDYISPSPTFYTLQQRLDAGLTLEEAFRGPWLNQGFLDADETQSAQRRTSIRTSDLLHTIMNVDGVRAVRTITVAERGGLRQEWSLDLEETDAFVPGPRFDRASPKITLMRDGRALVVDAGAVLADIPLAGSAVTMQAEDVVVDVGRDRNVSNFRSIQYLLPSLYAVGDLGLPASAPTARRAYARQLQAYLLLFDQLLANHAAQIAHLSNLFAFEGELNTYVAGTVRDAEQLDLPALWVRNATEHASWLADNVAVAADGTDPATQDLIRRNRLLSHLLGRFGESFADYALVLSEDLPLSSTPKERLARDQQAFLQSVSHLTSGRGSGVNILKPWSQHLPTSDVCLEHRTGLAERIMRKLGLDAAVGECFLMIEHVWLKPLPEDLNQLSADPLDPAVPLLGDVVRADPYSLQISFVFPLQGAAGGGHRFVSAAFRQLVDRTVREETPAHIVCMIQWVNSSDWNALSSAYVNLRQAHHAYWSVEPGVTDTAGRDHIALRDARDQVAELLGLGKTFPLRDLTVTLQGSGTVQVGDTATIQVQQSQAGVSYALYPLYDDDNPYSAAVNGTGGTIELVTPTNPVNRTYRILATKLESSPDFAVPRRAFLHAQPRVLVGLALGLGARITGAELLDANDTSDTGPRLVNYGDTITVEVDDSQAGVDYELVDASNGAVISAAAVAGNLGTITITGTARNEDVDVQVRATNTLANLTDRLTIVMPLKVRANPAVSASAAATVVEHKALTNINLTASQATASYEVWVRPIEDREFFESSSPEQLTVLVDSNSVTVDRPNTPANQVWQDLDGFVRFGGTVDGTGGTVSVSTGVRLRDAVILIKAVKNHTVDAGTIPSEVQLYDASMVLVRPNPVPTLSIRLIAPPGASAADRLELMGGQAAVYYIFATTLGGAALGSAAYVHQRNTSDTANLGVEDQLRPTVDMAIARSQPVSPSTDLATLRPLNPLIELNPTVAGGTTLYLSATKAMTQAKRNVDLTATVDAFPTVSVAVNPITSGATAQIEVATSDVADTYELRALDGTVIGAAQEGSGATLTFATDGLDVTTTFMVVATRPGGGISVERAVEVTVTVT